MTDLDEAIELHEHATRTTRLVLDHGRSMPFSQLEAVVKYHDSLRERASRLEHLSHRLREQARRAAKERQSSAHTCRFCAIDIHPDEEGGACSACRNTAREL